MTLTAQLHYQNEQYWRGVVLVVVLINFMLFLTDGLTSQGFPKWWIYPSCISGMVLLAFYAWRFGEFSHQTTAFYEYSILNVLLFLTWLEQPKTFPWFIIPMFVLAIPLIVVYMRTTYAESRVWLYVCVSLVVLNIMFFFGLGVRTLWVSLVFGVVGSFRGDSSILSLEIPW